VRTLSLSSGEVERILALQRRLSEQSPAPIGESGSSDFYRSDPAVREFFEEIDALGEVEKDELEAVAWLGRGDFKSFDSALTYAHISSRSGISSHLAEKMALEYLEHGLEILNKAKILLSNSAAKNPDKLCAM
jgi:hypothetical protein